MGHMSKRSTFQCVVDTPVGPLGITTSQNRVSGVEFLDRRSRSFTADAPLLLEVARQLDGYFNGDVAEFSLPLDLHGTDFQKRVWQALLRIRPGEVRTYGDIARELLTSPRAVGNACRRNPIPIIVPCHRVVAANGIGGFSGTTSGRRLEVKRWLLGHEGVCL